MTPFIAYWVFVAGVAAGMLISGLFSRRDTE